MLTPADHAWKETQWQALAARVAARDALAVVAPMPQPVLLVSSRDDQSAFAAAQLPRTARSLTKAAGAAGWAVDVRWSLLAIPAGWRESAHHKVVELAHLLYCVSVRLAAYGVRAFALWREPGGFDHAELIGTERGHQTYGIQDLINYVKGGQ